MLFGCYIAGATWNCCCLGARSVYTIQPCTISRHLMQSHIRKVYAVFSSNLPPALSAECPGSFTCYCGNTGGGTDTEIRVSTESRPWRRKFSRCSCRDLNLRPFGHESGTLTTELSRHTPCSKSVWRKSLHSAHSYTHTRTNWKQTARCSSISIFFISSLSKTAF